MEEIPMCRNSVLYLLIATLTMAFSSIATAQATKPTDKKAPAAPVAQAPPPPQATQSTQTLSKKGEPPKPSPGWVIVEEDWWLPLRYDFANSLFKARAHFRAGEEKAAAAEIDKAVSWLNYAEKHADRSSAEDLATASADLSDYAVQLKSGKALNARLLDAAFAHASAALAKHHHFKAGQALAQQDMQAAGRHLMQAVDHLRDAASSANYEYGQNIVDIYEKYAPNGHWDETVILDKSEVESNLKSVEDELQKLAAKLDANR
jgi:hypothetical protein